MPKLFKHFSALNLSSEEYLMEWLLSLFSCIFTKKDSQKILGRIWDCFILEGELYAFKVALAILKYFEVELKMMDYGAATTFLSKQPYYIFED